MTSEAWLMNRNHQPQTGFVLVIVLAILVVLSLLAAATATSSERTIMAAQGESQAFESELNMISTRDTLLYMLATQRQTTGGMTVADIDANATLAVPPEDPDGLSALPTGTEIRLDGSIYQGLGNTQFSLQDDRGLISPNWASTPVKYALYSYWGAKSNQLPDLEAKVLDYQDEDDLHRVNGAEAPQYLARGLAPPTNRPLQTPIEIRKVLGFKELLADTDDDNLLSTITVSRGAYVNVNTAPPHVLELLPGITATNAKRIVDRRKLTPFTSTYRLQEDLEIPTEVAESLTLFAKPSGNLTLWDQLSGARHLMHWTLTPLAVGGPPWRIDYEVILPRVKKSDKAVAETAATPLLATGSPDR